MSVTELAGCIAKGELTAVKALQAYSKRAEQIHKATNCLTCWVPTAMQEAERCDDYFKQSGGKTLGPLHGVPWSVKDHFAVKGLPLTMGLQKLKERTSDPKRIKQ